MVLWNRAVASLGSTRVSLLLYLEPVVSVSGAAVLLGEPVTALMIGAGLLIMAGVVTAGTAASASARKHHERIPQRHVDKPKV
jgi:drug/metabolite transporter (DMT)-like permease